MFDVRKAIFEKAVSTVQWGDFLPLWVKVVRAVLFPLDTLFWSMSRNRGYQWDKDVWIIGGVRYSDQMLRALSRANGELFRAERIGDVVHLTHIGVTAVPITTPAARWYQF